MFLCCIGNAKDKESIVDKDIIPEITIIDFKNNPPTETATKEEWKDYLIAIKNIDIEENREKFYRLNNLARKFYLLKTLTKYIHNFNNCKKRKKTMKKRERIKRELIALQRMRMRK